MSFNSSCRRKESSVAKKTTLKRLGVGLGIAAVFAVFGLMAVLWMMGRPLYAVGSVRAGKNLRGPLEPPRQIDGSVWQVEPDIRLHFEAYGNGRPVLVVHGGPGSPYAKPWLGLEPLTDRFRFYYYHQRGCGESTRPFERFESSEYYANMTALEHTLGIGAQVADIERIRRLLSQEQLLIIGHSFGGFLASLYAAEFPRRVEKLILVAPAGVLVLPDKEDDLFQRMRAKIATKELAEYDSFLAEYLDFGDVFSKSEAELADLNKRMGQYMLAAMGDETAVSVDGPSNGGWMAQAMYFSMGASHDYRAAMKDVTMPVLIVHGADDQLTLRGSRMYDDWLPNSRFVMLGAEDPIRHAGHFVFNECPQEFGRVVAQFLAN